MPPAEPHNYRLATNPETGEHGYEVGYWSAGDPPTYIVQARCYDQNEAARLAAQFDANPPDHLPPDESDEGGSKEGDEDEKHAHKRARTSTHRR